MRIEVHDGIGLAVIVPRGCSLAAADEMVAAKAGWVVDKYVRYVEKARSAVAAPLGSGSVVRYLGRDLRLVSCRDSAAGGRVEVKGDELLVWAQEGDEPLGSALEAWYRNQAAAVIKRKVDALAAALSLRYKGLIIRGQRTRWGSCSQKGTLSFNWRLIMAPEPVLDYVVIHEVAHLREMNHTRRFWELVAEWCPSWRENKRWLNDHGAELASMLRGRT